MQIETRTSLLKVMTIVLSYLPPVMQIKTRKSLPIVTPFFALLTINNADQDQDISSHSYTLVLSFLPPVVQIKTRTSLPKVTPYFCPIYLQ